MAKPVKEEKEKKPKKPKKEKKQKNIHGIVTAVGFEPDTLTVRIKGKAQEFSVSADATVSLNKADAEFGDLLAGDNVFLVVDAAGVVTAIDARREEEEEVEPVPPAPVPA